MPAILVATDFSPVADNALRYACKLALHQDADIAILHTYALPVLIGDMTMAMPIADFQEDAEQRMKKLVASIRQDFPQITFRGSVVYGDIIDAINDLTINEAPALVIVGNGYSLDNPAWIDSTLLEALRELNYPVLAVPDNITYEQVRKIGFVYDNDPEGSLEATRQLADLTTKLGAELHIYTAQTDDSEEDIDINEAAREQLAPANPLYHHTREENVDDGVLTFIGKYQIDWLVVMPRHHSFFESLFHKSHTKALVNSVFIPVLALHETTVK